MTRRPRRPGDSGVSPIPPSTPAVSPVSPSFSSSSSFRSSNVILPPPGISEFPSSAAGAVSGSTAAASPLLPDAAAAVHARPRTAACPLRDAAAVFLPGDPLLPLVCETGEDAAASAVQRLGELLQQYDGDSAAVVAAAEAGAAAAEVHAAAAAHSAAVAGISSSAQPSSTSLVPCIFAQRFPLFPYCPAYISCCMQRYEPLEGDVVLGLINGKLAGEFYTVSLRGRMDGLLPQISGFEGATKQQRPRLRSGSVVLCRVERAAAAAAAQLTCVDVHCKKAWHSQQKTFGELQGGCLLDVPPPLAIRDESSEEVKIKFKRRGVCLETSSSLMAPHCFVLGALGEKMKFEMAAAANGRIWVKAHAAGDIVLIVNVLLASYGKEPHVIQAIVNALLSRRHENKMQ